MQGLVWDRDGADWPNRDSSSFVEAAGLRWHVQRMGEGPPLLLIHGTGAATHSWRGLLPLLAQHFSVIAPDLPGHGFTQSPPPHRLSLPGMAADLGALLRKLEARPEVAVGHSAGAAIVARMCLAGRMSPRLLVALNGAFMPFGGVANHLFSPLGEIDGAQSIGAARVRLAGFTCRGAVERLIGNTGSTIDPAGIALYRKLVRNPAHVAAALRMMANWKLEPLLHDLPRLTTALVMVVAANDRSISPEVAQQVREILPHAVIERLPGLGHLAHEEQPQLIAHLIERYARTTAGRASGAKNVNWNVQLQTRQVSRNNYSGLMLDTTSARPTPQIPSHRQPHAVVIGSGFGGLAAAVRLGAKGYRVTVLEKLDAPGGRAYVYRQDGFTFDAGPTIVTAPFLFEELWKLCGRKMSDDVTLVPVSPFYRIRFQDGSHFDYSGDADAMRREIARFSPGDVDGYDAYMKASEAIFKVGFEQPGRCAFQPLDRHGQNRAGNDQAVELSQRLQPGVEIFPR